MEVGCGERNYNPFIGGPIPHFDGWDECYRRIWHYDRLIKNKFNIDDEVWAITGHRVVSDGGYGVIGGGYCLLVWGDAEETKGKRGRRWCGVGPAGRPFPILLWR